MHKDFTKEEWIEALLDCITEKPIKCSGQQRRCGWFHPGQVEWRWWIVGAMQNEGKKIEEAD